MGGRQRCWVLGVGVVTDEKMWYKFVCVCVCVCNLLQVLIIVSRILLLPWWQNRQDNGENCAVERAHTYERIAYGWINLKQVTQGLIRLSHVTTHTRLHKFLVFRRWSSELQERAAFIRFRLHLYRFRCCRCMAILAFVNTVMNRRCVYNSELI